VELLKELSRHLPADPVVVNIGAGAGTSGLAFMESRDDLTLYTVDTRLEVSPLGSLGSELVVFREAGFSESHRHHQIHGDSILVGLSWEGPKIDLVFMTATTPTRVKGILAGRRM
jgi:hypothetical protein